MRTRTCCRTVFSRICRHLQVAPQATFFGRSCQRRVRANNMPASPERTEPATMAPPRGICQTPKSSTILQNTKHQEEPRSTDSLCFSSKVGTIDANIRMPLKSPIAKSKKDAAMNQKRLLYPLVGHQNAVQYERSHNRWKKMKKVSIPKSQRGEITASSFKPNLTVPRPLMLFT
jgi:hypothetical protein